MKTLRKMKLIWDGKGEEVFHVDSPQKVFDFFRDKIGNDAEESIVALYLDNKNQTIGWTVISKGTVSESLLHPRELYKYAIACNASSVIIAHNHPSSILNPSSDDISSTKRVRDAGATIGIPLVDHVIITGDEYYSMKEKLMILR